MAFDRLDIDYESVGISEIDKYAVVSYAAIHENLAEVIEKYEHETKKILIDERKSKGIKKKPRDLNRKITKYYQKEQLAIAHKLTKNYGDITKINGHDLPKIDVFTYSFPCTDLSKAGKQKGLNSTRSGLVYEVLRILQELKYLDNLPKVLIMENVVDLVQTKFIREFNEIQLELEGLGYSNYVETLNAKNYGVAQNRDRVFMVSILGDYYYEFPKPFKLENRLKDYLEEKVDEKYYLKNEIINKMFTSLNDGDIHGVELINQGKEITREVELSHTLMARDYKGFGNQAMVGVAEPVRIGGVFDNDKGRHQAGSIWDKDGLSPTIDTMQGGHRQPCIIEPRLNEPLLIGGMQKNQSFKDDGVSTCLTSSMGTGGGFVPMVVEPFFRVPEATEQGYAEACVEDLVNLAQPNSKTRRGRVGKQISQTLTTDSHIAVVEPLRIRKLTPLECWRLMGIDDECFRKAEKVCSNSQLYKQAGNGIVVDVFAAIIDQMRKETT